MAYYAVTPKIGGQAIGTTSSTQASGHILGEKVSAQDSGVTGVKEATFVYAKMSVACVAGDVIWIKATSGFGALLSDTLSKTAGELAFAQGTFAADDYGWLMQDGLPLVRCKPGVEASVALYVNASVGTLSATTVSGAILGVVALTSVTTTVGAITCRSQFPTVMRAAGLNQI